VDAVVVDTSTLAEWTVLDHRVFRGGLDALGFELRSDDQGIQVYLRR
jgi:hypothetical protein